MKPLYEGSESSQFYEYLRVGEIRQIDTNIPDLGGKVRRTTYGTAVIQWVDARLGTVDEIQISFPAAGRGWGIFAYPKPGDVVVVGFRAGGYGVILGYLMSNPFLERGSIDQADGTRLPYETVQGQAIPYRPNRYLSGGELLLKSFQGSEIYMDRFANMRMIVREMRNDDSDSITDFNLAGDIELSKEKSKIWDIWLGKARSDDLYLLGPGNVEGYPFDNVKSSFNGTDINMEMLHKSGADITVDAEGSMGRFSPKDILEKAINSYKILVGNGVLSASMELLNDGSIVITDREGSKMTFDAQGKITVESGSSKIEIDKNSSKVEVTAQNVTVSSANVKLGGDGATHPVTVSDLLAIAFNTHQHISADPGKPTSPPAVPLFPALISSTTTKAL